MPEERRFFSDKLWHQLKQSEDYTTFATIKHSLNFRGHPDIQSGRKCE